MHICEEWDKGSTINFVDDIIVRATKNETEKFYKRLNKKFKAKAPEYLSEEAPICFLGFDIKMVKEEGKTKISMDQTTALNRFLDDQNVKFTKGLKCPMPDGKAMWTDMRRLSAEETKKYQQLVGALNYFSITTRYDISHAVSRLGQMAANPTKGAAKALVRVLRYLRANDKLALEGEVTQENVFECYSDSDHAADRPQITKSQTGVMITLNGVPVQWASKKQVAMTATSSALAEIYALSETARQSQLTVWKLQELGIQVSNPIIIQVDNTQAISFQRSTCLVSKLRGMVDLRWAWVQELRDKKKIGVQKVGTDLNKADILTKCMPAYKYSMRLRTLRRDQESRHVANLVQVLSS